MHPRKGPLELQHFMLRQPEKRPHCIHSFSRQHFERFDVHDTCVFAFRVFTTSNKKLLVAKGIAIGSKKLLVAPGTTTSNKKLLVLSCSVSGDHLHIVASEAQEQSRQESGKYQSPPFRRHLLIILSHCP